MDPIHDVKPAKMLQAPRGNTEALQTHAATIIRNEKAAKIEDKNGVLQPVTDAGGRECMQRLILDVQSTARSLGESAQATVERAVAKETNPVMHRICIMSYLLLCCCSLFAKCCSLMCPI